jgi:hypothetical protein
MEYILLITNDKGEKVFKNKYHKLPDVIRVTKTFIVSICPDAKKKAITKMAARLCKEKFIFLYRYTFGLFSKESEVQTKKYILLVKNRKGEIKFEEKYNSLSDVLKAAENFIKEKCPSYEDKQVRNTVTELCKTKSTDIKGGLLLYLKEDV